MCSYKTMNDTVKCEVTIFTLDSLRIQLNLSIALKIEHKFDISAIAKHDSYRFISKNEIKLVKLFQIYCTLTF